MVACIKEKAWQKVKQGWDCSQIGNEEKEAWQEGNQMALQCAEDEKFQEIWEQRRKERSAPKLEAMQKAPELVVHKRMAQGEEVTGAKVERRVVGWSTEDMKDQASCHSEGTEEMRTRRSSNPEEIDQCWKKFAKKSEWTSTRSRTAKERHTEAETLRWDGDVYVEAGSTKYENGEKIVGQESSPCSESTTCSVGKACMKFPRQKKK